MLHRNFKLLLCSRRCGEATEKDDACMHVDCATCKLAFCYCCGGGEDVCNRGSGCDSTSPYLETNPGWEEYGDGRGCLVEFHRRRLLGLLAMSRRLLVSCQHMARMSTPFTRSFVCIVAGAPTRIVFLCPRRVRRFGERFGPPSRSCSRTSACSGRQSRCPGTTWRPRSRALVRLQCDVTFLQISVCVFRIFHGTFTSFRCLLFRCSTAAYEGPAQHSLTRLRVQLRGAVDALMDLTPARGAECSVSQRVQWIEAAVAPLAAAAEAKLVLGRQRRDELSSVFRRCFDALDADKSGFIEKAELADFLRKVGEVGAAVDTVPDPELCEFMKTLRELTVEGREQTAAELLTEWDNDGDGKVSFEEIVAAFEFNELLDDPGLGELSQAEWTSVERLLIIGVSMIADGLEAGDLVAAIRGVAHMHAEQEAEQERQRQAAMEEGCRVQ
eukprot:SAG11_NODE_2129_length_3780_cov_2.847324_3_plen_442_part_00